MFVTTHWIYKIESENQFGEWNNLSGYFSSNHTKVLLQGEEISPLCSNCGTNNEDESVYCGSCGTRLSSSYTSSTTVDHLSRLTMLRTIPQKALQNAKQVRVKAVPKTAGIISRFELSIPGKLKILMLIPQRIAQIAVHIRAKIPSIARVFSPPQSDQSSKLRNITKDIPNVTNKLSLLDKFSSLPLWLTMPLLFACSFAFGMIVKLLTWGLWLRGQR